MSADPVVSAAVFDAALDIWRGKSQKAIYRRDFAAWLWDVCGERMYAKMAEISSEALFGKIPQTLIRSGNGVGKDLALDTPILTTRGWSTMGEIQVGDWVFDEQGKPTRVTFKSDIMHNPCYRVTFDDGHWFIAGEGHEWNTLTLSARSHARLDDWRDGWTLSKTVSTAEMARTVLRGNQPAKNHLIPLARPLEYPKRELPIDPYVLGAWLGDGTTIRAEMTLGTEKEFIAAKFAAAGYPLRHDERAASYPNGPRPYRWMTVVDKDTRTSALALALKRAGVLNNKHIPSEYLSASIEQRIELVRGFMDTDGWANAKAGIAGWSQSNEPLADQFAELLTGLGVRVVRWSKKTAGRDSHSMQFRPWFDPFTAGHRKSDTYLASPLAQRTRTTGRAVVSVEPTLTVSTACITVESPSHLYLAGRGLVPTHNTHGAARWAAWWVTAFEPRESLVIITGPKLQQVEFGVFANLKRLYGDVEARRITGRLNPDGTHDPLFEKWPGWINEQNEWIMPTASGNEALALAAVPSAHEAASRLVGLRKPGGRNLIVADEAGGLHDAVWDATMALQTSGGSRGIYIGNPNNRGDGFFQRFEDLTKYGKEYNRYSISAYDTPALTGEIVYPDDPQRDHELKASGLTSRAWVASMERIFVDAPKEAEYQDEDPVTGETLVRVDPFWVGPKGERPKLDGSFRVRVLGEFADEADSAFFTQRAIDAAYEADLSPAADDAQVPCVLGVDIARMGSDDSVVYSNRGGKIRFVASWNKTTTTESARRIHELALELDAKEVRIDSAGVGAGPLDMLTSPLLEGEFGSLEARPYKIIGIDGGTKGPDTTRYANTRAFNHHQIREAMLRSKIDLDPNDKPLWRELVALTYRYNTRQALQITPKDELRKKMNGSPDRLDAMIYAGVDLEWLNDLEGLGTPGDTVFANPEMFMEASAEWRLEPDYPL